MGELQKKIMNRANFFKNPRKSSCFEAKRTASGGRKNNENRGKNTVFYMPNRFTDATEALTK